MPKSDTWPGGVAMEPSSNMGSAGSCDSVISMNSSFSEDNLEHLSAEERACLLYLEETIEALEVQEDSGSSNDGRLAAKATRLSAGGQTRVDDGSSFEHDETRRDQKSLLTCGVPTPLLLANGVASHTTEPETPELPAEPATKSRPIERNAEDHALNPASEPQTTPSPALTTDTKDLGMPVETKPETPVTESVADSKISASATQTEMLYPATDGDNSPKSVPTDTRLYSGHPTEASETGMGLILPPSDFRDKPGPHGEPEDEKALPLSEGTAAKGPLLCTYEEDLGNRASMKKTPVDSPANHEPPSKPPVEVAISPSVLVTPSGTLPNPPPEAAEPRSPPAVAPKPKKLPSNIILKSHKSSLAGCDGSPGHSVSSTSDRMMLDPQRVRMEALRKLGLLKSEDADSGPALSPKSPKSRRSWAAPSSPISPAAPRTPTPPSTPFPALVSSPAPAPVPSSTPATMTPPATSIAEIQAPDILPVPAAFSDHTEPPPAHIEPSSLSEPTVNVKAQSNTPPLTPPALHSPRQLRNTRPRPASLGSGKEFSSVQGEGSPLGQSTSKVTDKRMSLPGPTFSQHTGDSQRLPRSHGISVLICPRGKNGEDRREALKKLGLIRD